MRRLSFEEGVSLFKNASLQELQEQAMKMRYLKNPAHRITFILDSNPNYTNVCYADCSFCAFYRHQGAKDSYTKTISEVMNHFEIARKAGLTTVLLQGGLHPGLSLEYYTELILTALREYPDIHLHGFSAPEIWNIAEVSKKSIAFVLEALFEAGLRTIPGGGAEILSESVRKSISPKKMAPGVWMEVHSTAHKIGYRTTATMMYGHVETPEDVIEHLETLRASQDVNPGFTAFIPWSYKRERTALRRKVKNWAGEDSYFRILALSRLYLDNFDHIQASWFGEGKEIGIKSLYYGADDFGGIVFEENVHRATNHINKADHNLMLQMIRQAGFEPAQRDVYYNILRTYDQELSVKIPESQKITEEDCLTTIDKERAVHKIS